MAAIPSDSFKGSWSKMIRPKKGYALLDKIDVSKLANLLKLMNSWENFGMDVHGR